MRKWLGDRYPVGAYYFRKESWTDAGMAQLRDMGVDFLVSVPADQALLALCEKYGIGLIASENIPLWWGGNGEKAGQYAAAYPLEKLAEARANYPRSAALWGDYCVDEPHVKDFKHIQAVVARYRELFPGSLPFVNLYPNYASLPKNTAEETVSQLGTATYAEHIASFVRAVDLPYLCFDFYPFGGPAFDSYFENFEIVSRACRDARREMWVIIQTGAWKAEELLQEFQIRWQANLCLAFGATCIMHASYSKGWWDATTACINEAGEQNATYAYAQRVNAELHALGGEFLRFRPLGVAVRGDLASAHPRLRPQLEYLKAQEQTPALAGICEVASDKAIVAGVFAERNGTRRALMLVNTHDPFDAAATAAVTLTAAPGRACTLHRETSSQTVRFDANGQAALKLKSGAGVFAVL